MTAREQSHPKKSLMVERDGHVVTVTVTCSDMMEAMKLYDEVCVGASAGYIALQVETVPNT